LSTSAISLAVCLALPSTLLLPLASPYTFIPVLMMSPAGLPVAARPAIQGRSWTFASAGIDRAGSKFARSLRRDLVAFDRRSQLGRPSAESDDEALGFIALVDRQEIALEHNVVDPRRRARPTLRRGHSHALDLLDQLRRDLSAQLPAHRDLLGGLRCGGSLAGQRGVRRNIGGRGGEVVHPDGVGPRELPGHEALSVGDLGRGAPGDDGQSEKT